MKIRNLSDLQSYLDNEISWRRRELSNLLSLIDSARHHHEKAIARAIVPLIYAHWEGFIKASSTAYINFVNNQKIAVDKLTSNLASLAIKPLLTRARDSRLNQHSIELIEQIRFRFNTSSHLSEETDTKSNLNYRLFTDIALTCGINLNGYATKKMFIDIKILKQRNEIAHGEYIECDPKEMSTNVKTMISIIESYKIDLINNAANKAYLALHI